MVNSKGIKQVWQLLYLFYPFHQLSLMLSENELAALDNASANYIIAFVKNGTLAGGNAFYIFVKACANAVIGGI